MHGSDLIYWLWLFIVEVEKHCIVIEGQLNTVGHVTKNLIVDKACLWHANCTVRHYCTNSDLVTICLSNQLFVRNLFNFSLILRLRQVNSFDEFIKRGNPAEVISCIDILNTMHAFVKLNYLRDGIALWIFLFCRKHLRLCLSFFLLWAITEF